MAALVYAPREHYGPLPLYRSSSYPQETTLAMHWDGTYRDRVSDGTKFWTEEDGDYSRLLDKFSRVARHLA